jgi:hypothetical protein
MPVYTFAALVYFVLVLAVSAGVGAITSRLPGSSGHRDRLAQMRAPPMATVHARRWWRRPVREAR